MNNANATLKTACVIVAGGMGSRCGQREPKQFCMLGGEPVFFHSLRFFDDHPLVDLIVVVVPSQFLRPTQDLILKIATTTPVKLVEGGARRQDSVAAGIAAAGDCEYVAIHDGARPFPPENFEEGLLAAKEYGGAVFALPSTDSIKITDGVSITKTVPRADLWAVQTPQIFYRSKIVEALHKCETAGKQLTDDASAFEFMGWQVTLVSGSRSNLKITYPEDFIMAEALLKGRKH